MKIIKLILHKYKRFFLNEIETFTYTPNQKIQIILGSNGSGKSSLFSELSPLPSDIKKDFNQGGYKEIHIEHNNNFYVISSGKVKNKHSFIENDKELNQSGTRQIQLELVKEHFNLTPTLFNIFLGKENFTSMSISERRKLFISISKIDYNYALKVYDQLRTRHRDLVANIKLYNTKLLELESKVLTKEQKDIIKNKLKNLKDFLDILLTSKTNNVNLNTVDFEDKLQELNIKAKGILDKFKVPDYLNIKNIDNEILKTKIELETLNKNIESFNKILEEIAITDNLTHNLDRHKIANETVKLNKRLAEIEEKNIYKIDLENVNFYIKAFRDVYSDLIALLSSLEEYKDLEDETLEKDLNTITTLYNLSKNDLENLLIKEKELNHKCSTDKIECPICNSKFHLGYDENEHKDLLKQIEIKRKKIEKIEEEKNKLEKLANKVKERDEIIKKIALILVNNKSLSGIWEDIFTGKKIHKDFQVIINSLQSVLIKLDYFLEYPSIIYRLNSIEEELRILQVKEELEKKNVLSRKEDIENKLTSFRKNKKDLEFKLNNLETNKKVIYALDKLREEINKVIKQKKSSYNKELEILRNEKINEMISITKEEISEIEIKLTNSNHYEMNKITLLEELEDLKKREKVTKLMVKGMSPGEGLIAKSIYGFLNNFTKNMNYIIENVWSYKMEVLPCMLGENTELDYKFPVLVEDREIITDVSKTSSAMNEIINLAFKITIMKFMDMKDFPLFLDEFGSKMDETHRKNAYNIIDSILNNNFEQIFLISHFESMYGRFNNADIIVLSKENLSGVFKNDEEVVKIK